MRSCTCIIVCVVLPLSLVACANGSVENEAPRDQTGALEAGEEVGAEARDKGPRVTKSVAQIGDRVTSGGIELIVSDVVARKSISYVSGVMSDVTPDGNARTVDAVQGGRYVYVMTNIENNTSAGIDLTCGLPIEAVVVNEKGQTFSSVDGLSQIKGNPGCNEILNPGFATRMTWVYLVAPESMVTSFEFRDVTDFNVREEIVKVELPPT